MIFHDRNTNNRIDVRVIPRVWPKLEYFYGMTGHFSFSSHEQVLSYNPLAHKDKLPTCIRSVFAISSGLAPLAAIAFSTYRDWGELSLEFFMFGLRQNVA